MISKIRSFLGLVEIQTKVASVIPFVMGVLFSMYRYNRLEPINLSILFISMICLDMATTAINNYMDYRKTQEENVIFLDGLRNSRVLFIIFLLLILSLITGFVLFLRTDLVVLLIGVTGFIIGILYSFGPIPLSYTPLGELFSGTVMGGLIFFVTVYIQQEVGTLVAYQIEQWFLHINLNLVELGVLLLISIPSILLIANIMLANNLCDLEKDRNNGRKTLPIVLGHRWGLLIYNSFYILTYISIVIAVILNILPVVSLIVLLTAIPVIKHLMIFNNSQEKSKTFVLSVKNFILISITVILSLIIGLL